jgi:heptosyltransferase-2
MLVILIAGIGDVILSTKALRALRLGHPDADIHLLTTTQAASLAKNYKDIDYVWTFPIRELRDSKVHLFDVLKLLRQFRKIDFSLAVNLYRVYSWRGALMMGLLFLPLRAKFKVGHNHKGFGIFIDKKVTLKHLQNIHFADAMMEIAKAAGGIPDEKGIEVFWSQEAEAKWEHFFLNPDVVRIAINPGADHPQKRWSPERYAFVADQLAKHFNAEIILLGGPGEETLATEIQKKMKLVATNLAGKLTLNDLVYIISRLNLLLSNDSGPMHIAAAVKTPVVAIFGPEDPRLFGPYTTPDLYRIVYKEVDCRPCRKKNCKKPICLDLITPEEVIEKCVEMLTGANC